MKKLLFPFLLSFLLIACAAQQGPSLISSAREAFQRAEQAKAGDWAPNEYRAAQLAMEAAEQAQVHEHDEREKDHQAFLAKVRSEIALLASQESVNRHRIEDLEKQKSLLVDQRKQIQQSADQLRAQQEMLILKERDLESLKAQNDKIRKQLTETLAEIARVQESNRGIVVTLSNVLFETNKADLKAGNRQKLVQLATVMKNYPDHKILIEGHTDAQGSEVYNRILSENRARSVEEVLAEAGLTRGNMVVRGYGKDFPVASNKTASGRLQNRRVDIVVLNPNQTPAESFLDRKG